MAKLAPSILSADFSKLGQEVEEIERAGADIIHIDVMDGHFVPNISYGATVMKSLLGKTKLKFDVHLMIENVDQFIDDFVTESTEYITVHQEACTHIHRSIEYIKSLGIKAGVSINPGTPIIAIKDILENVDMVLIMSVNPGFGGQKFIPATIAKIKELAMIRKEKGLSFKIEVDGGITLKNVEEVVGAGGDIIVAGSSVFNTENIEKAVEGFNNFIK